MVGVFNGFGRLPKHYTRPMETRKKRDQWTLLGASDGTLPNQPPPCKDPSK